MDKVSISILEKDGRLRRRQIDKHRILSMLGSAKTSANFVISLPLNDDSATIIFREIYESIRQIGDAMWWSLGFEPIGSHDTSMKILLEMDIKQKVKLNNLDWFRRTRNNANYRGYRVSIEQTKEIKGFWRACSEDLIRLIKNSVD